MKTIEVVAAIIVHDGKILATQRGYGDYAGGWEFPGGKREPGEQPEEALRREIREELDAEIEVGRHLVTVSYEYPEFFLHMQCFVCALAGSMKLLEHSAARLALPAIRSKASTGYRPTSKSSTPSRQAI